MSFLRQRVSGIQNTEERLGFEIICCLSGPLDGLLGFHEPLGLHVESYFSDHFLVVQLLIVFSYTPNHLII